MHSFYLPPGNLDLITVAGPDALKLLQGQLTCDVAAVPDPGFCRGALCNNKGRVLATFVLVRQEDAFHLVLTKGLGEVLVLALKKYLPFYKCELRPATDTLCLGICGDASLAAPGLHKVARPESGQCVDLADGWVCNLGQQQYLVYTHAASSVTTDASHGTLTDWLAYGLHSGHFPFIATDVEKFTPQELHLDRNGYVSFTKGCYTGQEIVARMHYRGKLKRALFLLAAPTNAAPATGEGLEILDANGTLLGTTMRVLHSDGTLYALIALPSELDSNPPSFVSTRAGLQMQLRVF